MFIPISITLKVILGMDVAASEFYTADGKYDLDKKAPSDKKSAPLSDSELADYYKKLCKGSLMHV